MVIIWSRSFQFLAFQEMIRTLHHQKVHHAVPAGLIIVQPAIERNIYYYGYYMGAMETGIC